MVKFAQFVNEATFSKQSVYKHDGKYPKLLIKDIEADKPIRLGKTGDTSVKIMNDYTNQDSAVAQLKQAIKDDTLEKRATEFTGSKSKYYFTTDSGDKIKFTDIFKGPYSGSKDKLATDVQENISAALCRMALSGEPATDEAIYNLLPNCPAEWLESFKYQYKGFVALKNQLNLKNDYAEISRDGPFMTYSTKMAKKFGFPKKDAWNPADIWLVKDSSVIPQIESENPVSIDHFNSILKKLFIERKVIGISLKKLIADPKIYILNIDNKTNYDDTTIESIVCNFAVKNDKFVSKELVWRFSHDDVHLVGKYRSKNVIPFKESQMLYTYKKGGAQIGDVPKPLRDGLAKKLSGINIKNCKDMPLDFKAFTKSDYNKELKELFHSKIDLGVQSYNQALKNIEQMYNNGEEYIETAICTKLQSLHMAYMLHKADQNGNLESLLVQWYYGAKKIGESMGPYVLIADN